MAKPLVEYLRDFRAKKRESGMFYMSLTFLDIIDSNLRGNFIKENRSVSINNTNTELI